jgi:hypothetical protein
VIAATLFDRRSTQIIPFNDDLWDREMSVVPTPGILVFIPAL